MEHPVAELHAHPGRLGCRQEFLAWHVAPVPAPAGHRLGTDDAELARSAMGRYSSTSWARPGGGAGLVLTRPGLAGAGRTRVGLTSVGLARLCLTRLGRSQLGLAVLIPAGLARAESPAQLRREVEVPPRVRVRHGREDLQPPAAGLLGPGHRGVGVTPDVPGRAAVRERDADAGGQDHGAVGGAEWFGGHAGQDALGQLDDLPGRRGFGEQDREHVAAPAGHRAARRDRGP